MFSTHLPDPLGWHIITEPGPLHCEKRSENRSRGAERGTHGVRPGRVNYGLSFPSCAQPPSSACASTYASGKGAYVFDGRAFRL